MAVLVLRSAVEQEEEPNTAPQWFLDQGDSTWSTPVSNTAEDVGASNATTDAWNGATVDQDYGELIAPALAGHTNGSDNSVFVCAIRTASPAWYRMTEASTATGGSEATGDYGDGNMRAVHGWHRPAWGNGKVWYAGMDGMYISGAWSTRCWSFDRASLGSGPFPVSAANAPWENHGLGLTQNGTLNWEAGCANFDPATNLVWSVAGANANSAGQSVYTVNTLTNAITPRDISLIDVDQAQPRWAALAPDLRLWILGCMYERHILLLDLDNPESGFIVKTTSGTPSAVDEDSDDGCGAVYHEASRAVLCWENDGANLRKLTIPADPINGSWVWSQVTPAGSNSVTPVNAHSTGIYSKFNIINDMGNGQSALVLWPRYSSEVYVYKLPVAGV